MQPVLRFGVVADPASAGAGFAELSLLIARVTPVTLEPAYFDDYDAMSAALRANACDIAWTPPLLAHALIKAGAVVPLVAMGRKGGTAYYAAFAVLPDAPYTDVPSLVGTRIGWVSKLSAAGYVFPRLYLRSIHIDPKKHFASETFAGSHQALGEALARGDVDVIATFATVNRASQQIEPPPLGPELRLVACAGPIPGDVIVATSSTPAEARTAVVRGLLSMPVPPNGELARWMNVARFDPVAHNHFTTIEGWLATSDPPPGGSRG